MKLGPADHYRPGDWKAACDRCGFIYHASQLHQEWQGLMVCPTCYEPRHPQETIRIRPERPIPWARPEPADVEIVVGPADPDALGRISSGVPDGFLSEEAQDGFYGNEEDGLITRNTQE